MFRSLAILLLSAVALTTASPQETDSARTSDPSLYRGNVDVQTSKQLMDALRGVHDKFLASGMTTQPPNTRPMYAVPEVVNAAYRQWASKPPEWKVCKDDIKEAIFASPAACMSTTLKPGNLPVHVGVPRVNLQRRNERCVYTSVRCVDQRALGLSPTGLLEQVVTQLGDRRPGSDFWYAGKLFAKHRVVNEATRMWLSKSEGDVKVEACKEVKGNMDSTMGSLVAAFYPTQDCRNNPNGRMPDGKPCRVVYVECI
jgi:hypothetical protein